MVRGMLVIQKSPSEIGREIMKRMLDQGLNSKDLATKAGVSDSSVSRLINGHSQPQNKTLKKIADVLGCTASELVFREGGDHANDRGEDPEGLPG